MTHFETLPGKSNSRQKCVVYQPKGKERRKRKSSANFLNILHDSMRTGQTGLGGLRFGAKVFSYCLRFLVRSLDALDDLSLVCFAYYTWWLEGRYLLFPLIPSQLIYLLCSPHVHLSSSKYSTFYLSSILIYSFWTISEFLCHFPPLLNQLWFAFWLLISIFSKSFVLQILEYMNIYILILFFFYFYLSFFLFLLADSFPITSIWLWNLLVLS